MRDIEQLGALFLGRQCDVETGAVTADPVLDAAAI